MSQAVQFRVEQAIQLPERFGFALADGRKKGSHLTEGACEMLLKRSNFMAAQGRCVAARLQAT